MGAFFHLQPQLEKKNSAVLANLNFKKNSPRIVGNFIWAKTVLFLVTTTASIRLNFFFTFCPQINFLASVRQMKTRLLCVAIPRLLATCYGKVSAWVVIYFFICFRASCISSFFHYFDTSKKPTHEKEENFQCNTLCSTVRVSFRFSSSTATW